jgi:uncharacterized protein (TIGR03067 family)
MKFLILAAIVSFASGSSAGPDKAGDKVPSTELKALQGTWTVVSSEQNGERRRDIEEVKKMRLTIEGDQWALHYNNNVKDKLAATLKFDPTSPKAIDFQFTAGIMTGEKLPAIFEVQGDELKFCFADESKQRPGNFNSREGPGGRWLLVLKREK